MTDPDVRNPRAAAEALVGRPAVVLEPSPPAVDIGPWFADDPLDHGSVAAVSPLPGASPSWDDFVAGDPGIAAFARAHWLADLAPLPAPPATLSTTRRALRTLAFHVLSPARQAATTKIGLRWTKGGFGTPFFDGDRQIRVEGTRLVLQSGDRVAVAPITTVRAAAGFLDVEPGPPSGITFHDPPPLLDLDRPLEIDADAVAFLDDWFGFSTLVLERLRAAAGSPSDTRVQLWPEHFDPAIELGDTERGARASYGASPGDEAIDQPYLYVSPWTAQEGPFWSAPFGGAVLTLDRLVPAEDQAEAATAFFADARRRLG